MFNSRMLENVDLAPIEQPAALWDCVVTRSSTFWACRIAVVVVAIAVGSTVPVPLNRAYVVFGIAAGGIVALQFLHRNARRRREGRLLELAAVNGLRYSPALQWTEPSALTNRAVNRRIEDEFAVSDESGTTRIGTLTFEAERASVHVTEHWSFISHSVPGPPLPHIILLSRNESGRSLPASLDRSQKLDLEGDFPTYFDAYCVPGTERDALYVLTPDLMASLVDNMGFASMELIENTIRFFTPGKFNPEDPKEWRRSVRILSTVGAKTLSRLRRYNRAPAAAGGLSEVSAVRAPTRKHLQMSVARSNRSTEIVGVVCALIVAGAFIWSWIH